MTSEPGTMFEPQKMVGSVSRVLASWRGFWGAHCVCLQEQSKAETDGGLRDDAATSIQACLAKAIIIATAETDEERKQFANPVFETTFAEYLDPYNSIINDPLVKWGGRVGG